ncbi:MAG TPA: aminotransferase class I/II-fold pyridoxal phosphate-dependent enzyme [Ignavibacteriaceae bacterium]|nr:aminotransferase class I/II-fold pyridoxal phosphate-dependent enzyme [Ignavibacteriaceae bacterium]
MSVQKYKNRIAAIVETTPERVFLYWKGRVALYAVLKAIGVGQDDEVIIPSFTCVVVPNAIIYLGAKPVYVDITPDTYNMDISKLEPAITSKTKVIICQNTFGLSSNLEEINQIAKKYNLFTIEDCTHGFGGYYNGKPNGSFCDAAFYSTQWNKPFSTGIGGFLVVNNESLLESVKALEREKIKPGLFDNITLTMLILFREFLINRYTYYLFINLYRLLSKKNLIIGSTQGNEMSDINIPINYFKDMSSVQICAGIKRLNKLNYVNNLRKKNAMDYTAFLKINKKKYISESLFGNHLFLKYPILVKDRELFFINARENKIILGDWFISPLYPIKENLCLWFYDKDLYNNSVEASKKMLNLPTDIKDNKRVIRFLKDNLDLIE